MKVAGSVGWSRRAWCADEAGEAEGSGETDGDANECERRAFAEDHEQDLASAGAKSHANSDLAGAACDVVGHDAVDADAGEDESRPQR